MKNSFLPLGYKEQTKEQILITENREKLYEYYGIPYGIFDNSSENIKDIKIEQDRTTAQILIMRGEKIPQDLEERLLMYKKRNKNSKENG